MKPTALQVNHDPQSGYMTAVYEGKPLSITVRDTRWEEAHTAAVNEDWELLRDILSPITAIDEFFLEEGDIEVKGSEVLYQGRAIHNTVVSRILEFIKNDLSPKPLMKFLARLLKNPSMQSINELYDFLDHEHLAITEGGYFIAYKAIKGDLWDKWTGETHFHEIGKEVREDRSRVDDDRNKNCSTGLHVGSWEYAANIYGKRHNGDKVVSVRVDPSEVVSVPRDFSAQKCRVCAYVPLEFIDNPYEGPLYKREEADYTPDDTEYGDYTKDGKAVLQEEWDDEVDEDEDEIPESKEELIEEAESVLVSLEDTILCHVSREEDQNEVREDIEELRDLIERISNE